MQKNVIALKSPSSLARFESMSPMANTLTTRPLRVTTTCTVTIVGIYMLVEGQTSETEELDEDGETKNTLRSRGTGLKT
jgi:hypothetical protein